MLQAGLAGKDCSLFCCRLQSSPQGGAVFRHGDMRLTLLRALAFAPAASSARTMST